MNKTARILFKILDVIMIFMLTFASPMSVLDAPTEGEIRLPSSTRFDNKSS